MPDNVSLKVSKGHRWYVCQNATILCFHGHRSHSICGKVRAIAIDLGDILVFEDMGTKQRPVYFASRHANDPSLLFDNLQRDLH